MRDINIIKKNISKMIEQNAPESDIDEYIASEGYTLEMLKNKQQEPNQEVEKLLPTATTDSAIANTTLNLPIGLGRAATGFVQAATDLGEAGAAGIEKMIYNDEPLQKETFGTRLAQRVGEENKQLEQEPLSTRIGVGAGEVLPYLTTGAGTGAAVSKAIGGGLGRATGLGAAGAIGGGTQRALSPQEESGLGNRALETVEGAAIGGAFGAGLGAIGEGVKYLYKPISKTTRSMVNRIKSELGSVKASKELATGQLKKGLEREGVDIAQALKQTSEEGKDLIDILDPRFDTINKGLKNLNRPETIKIADKSLQRINKTTNQMQDELVNLVSSNKITPEQAGDILGRNSKKIFDKAIEARRAKVEPLYKSALENGGKINLKTTLESGEKLGDILDSPFIKKVIQDVRGKAEEFAKTPATKFYGDIYQKTKPVFENKMVGRNNITGEPIMEKILKTGSKYKIPDNDIRVLYAVEKALGDMLKTPQAITGMSVDPAAINVTKKAIANFLDNSTPELTQARSLYSKLTRDIKGEGNSLIGKYAKYYNEGKSDELTKAAMNVLKMSPTRIQKARKIDPQGFNELLRSSIENKIASIQPLDDGVINPKAFTKAFFSDGGKSLQAATGDKELVRGFRRLAENLDIRFQRNRIAKAAMESGARSVRIPTGKTSALNRLLEFTEGRLVSSPKAQRVFVEYLFSPEGQLALKAIANSDKKVQEQITNSIIRNSIITNLITKNEEDN